MGKKAQAKAFRQMAAQLPPMTSQAYETNVLSGHQMLEKGNLKTSSGQLVHANGQYIEKNPVNIPVNHSRRLRKVHQQLGVLGLQAYVGHIRNVLEKQATAINANPA